MADANDDAVERDESTVPSEVDAEPQEHNDPEPTVDIDTKSINSRLDGLEDMMQRVMGKITQITDAQSVLVESGAIVDTCGDPSDNDGIDAFNDPSFDTLDLRITD